MLEKRLLQRELERQKQAYKDIDFSAPETARLFSAMYPAPEKVRDLIPYLVALYNREGSDALSGYPLGYVVQEGVGFNASGEPIEDSPFYSFIERAMLLRREDEAERIPLDKYKTATGDNAQTYTPAVGIVGDIVFNNVFSVDAEQVRIMYDKLSTALKREISLEDIRLVLDLFALCYHHKLNPAPSTALFSRIYNRNNPRSEETDALLQQIDRLRHIDVVYLSGDKLIKKAFLNVNTEIEAYVSGGFCAGIQLVDVPPIVEYLRQAKQLYLISARLFRAPFSSYGDEDGNIKLPAMNATARNRRLTDYLIMRIETMKKSKRARHNILWTTLYSWAKIDSTNNESRKAVRATVKNILDHLKAEDKEYFSRYKTSDRDVYITLPRSKNTLLIAPPDPPEKLPPDSPKNTPAKT